jgi:phenylalanyl-tRNA synthetase beta chain
MIGVLIWGRRHTENWPESNENVDFFDLKGDVERLLNWSGLSGVMFERLDDPVLHPGQSAQITRGGEVVGRVGRLHPEIERHLDVSGEVFLAELNAEEVLKRSRRRHGVVSKFPSVRRDLALVVKQDISAAEIVGILEKTLHEVLVDLRLFDVYQGKGIDSNEKSLGVGLTLQKPSATLTEEDIGQFMEQAVAALASGTGARLR